MQLVRLPAADAAGTPLPVAPRWWLRQIFDFRSTPPLVVALMALRQATAWVVGAHTSRTAAEVFAVDAEDEREVLAHERDRHLELWAGVAVTDGMLQVTTVVRLHGWRGRLYWLPVGALHGPVLRSMMRRAVTRAHRSPP